MSTEAPPRLLPVSLTPVVEPTVSTAPVIELCVRDITLRVAVGTDVRYVAALLGALRSSC